MSVNWQCSDCAAYKHAMEEFDEKSEEWSRFCNMRNSLIYATLITCYPSDKGGWGITEENWKEMWARVSIVEKVVGAYRRECVAVVGTDNRKITDRYFTPEEIHSMIGLQTNAGTKTRKEFEKHMLEILWRDANEKLNASKVKDL